MKTLRLFALILTAACQGSEMKVRAVQPVAAYVQADAAFRLPDFLIQQDQVCFLGKEVYGKADKFTAVRCENGMKGFVADTNGFEEMK